MQVLQGIVRIFVIIALSIFALGIVTNSRGTARVLDHLWGGLRMGFHQENIAAGAR